MISSKVQENLFEYSMQFEHALPCKHVCIENFFEENFAEKIIEDFPSYETTYKIDEFGQKQKKAVYENLSEISPFYAELSKYIQSEDFHQAIRAVTGIEDLVWGGESMYGGGTHDNVQFAELDAHVDFNYNEVTMEHRRVNVLIYLNKEWKDTWGGELELHSDPKNPAQDIITSYRPSFNRAVIMETTEHSWHGFPRIVLPEDKQHLSRKSLALYFYTKSRPKNEVHGSHSTLYIMRPVPEEFKVGEVISKDLHRAIYGGYKKRDTQLNLAHQKEIVAAANFATLREQNKQLRSQFRVPALGWAKQEGGVEGCYTDNWMQQSASGVFVAQRKISSAKLCFYLPESANFPIILSFAVDDTKVEKTYEQAGAFELALALDVAANEKMIFSYSSSSTFSGLRSGVNQDAREISVLLIHFIFE